MKLVVNSCSGNHKSCPLQAPEDRVLCPDLGTGTIINDWAALSAFNQDLHRFYQGCWPQAILCLARDIFMRTEADLQNSLAEGSRKVKNLHGLKEGKDKFMGVGRY